MDKEKETLFFSSDKPLADPKEDKLGYANFAYHVAQSLCKLGPTESLVIAVYGSWGSGKSTFLNFVVHYLEQESEEHQPIIVQFNPWWFSGREDLIKQFFSHVQKKLQSKKKSTENILKKLSEYSDLISGTPIPYSGILSKILKYFSRDKDIVKLKTEIEKLLRKQKKKILIVIDDIDRLIQNEIKQLFRTIKAVANFPNIIYLLASDREIVTKALTQEQGISGEAYLEKIVQVSIELPHPDKILLRRLFFKRLDEILASTPDELFDQTHWGNVYFDGIDHFINTPRDIVRLINAISMTYPAVEGEVNPVDFIAIETLRIFCPEVYNIIRNNPVAFTGEVPWHFDHTSEFLESFHKSWINQIQDKNREPIIELLKRLFPVLGSVWGDISYNSGWKSVWRKQLRICSPDIFPIYFRFSLPEGSISNVEMKAFLKLAKDPKIFGAKLVELAKQKRPDGTTKLSAFLERLEDYTSEDVSIDYIRSIIEALFDIGDQLLSLEDKPPGLFSFGIDIKIGRVLWQLLRRLNEPQRFEILKQAIEKGNSITTIMYEITELGQQHGKYGSNQAEPEEERLINAQHLKELEKLALEKIRNAAKEGILLQTPKLPLILHRWRNWADERECREWVQKIIASDKGLIEFLEKFLRKTFRQALSDRVGEEVYRLDPKWLEPFLDPSQIVERVKKILQNKRSVLTERQKRALKRFIKEYELRQQGKNPDLAT